MIQNIIVFLVVACAGWAVAIRYMPSALRHLIWQRISDVAHRRGWLRIAAHADTKREAAPACSSGCKQCDNCGASAPRPGTIQFIAPIGRMEKNAAK